MPTDITARDLLRQLASAMIETHALHLALLNSKILRPEQFDSARETIRAAWKPILDKLAGSDPVTLDDILRTFEGPVQ